MHSSIELGTYLVGFRSHAIVEPTPRTGNREDRNCVFDNVYHQPGTPPFREKMLLKWVQWSFPGLSPYRSQHTVMNMPRNQGSRLFLV